MAETKKLRIGMIASNYFKIGTYTKKGTEIFVYGLLKAFHEYKKDILNITTYCSGNSRVPSQIESVLYQQTKDNKHIGDDNHIMFELALISKAIKQQSKFDLFHVNMGNGEFVLPFAQFIRKPILITMHNSTHEPYNAKIFPLYKDLKNVSYVSICNNQRRPLPYLPYAATIQHGVDTKRSFTFNEKGGKQMIWTGRAIPEKGLDVVLQIAQRVKKQTKVFPIIKNEYMDWLQNEVLKKRDIINQIVRINFDFNVTRSNLIKEYQSSKLFLFPLKWEEPFGLTLIESMACGTPVISFARGSTPEIVRDGETGFLVNPSDDDIRGNWIIKKTGIEGLCEAVERIYAMPEDQYRQMRLNCRAHVEKNFTVEHMVDQYVEVYKEILAKNGHK